jgi:aryl-alcohol dehydrogenase-like predicted oxidoreductase
MQAFADDVRQGKALYIGVSDWTAEQLRNGHALAKKLGFQLISNQPQYSMLWRVIEEEVVPASEELGVSQIVWSPMAQGVLSGKYLPGQPLPEGSRATDEKGGAKMIERWMRDDVLTGVQELRPVAEDTGLTMPQLAVAWVLQNPNVASAIIGASRPEQIADTVAASGVTLEADIMKKIDAAIGSLAERDPSQTKSPETREG